MTVGVQIINGKTSKSVEVVEQEYGTGLLAYTHPARQDNITGRPFVNETFGISMNQDASTGGTPENIHNGLDNTYWTGTQIVGTSVTFNSTDRANSGAASVRADSPSTGDIWQYDRGSDIDLSNYVSITLFVNVNRRWGVGDSVSLYGWDTGTGTQVGNKILLEDFINESDFDVWQSVSIPLTTLGLANETIDAIRFEQESNAGQSGDFFVDDFQIQETGAPLVYTFAPRNGYRFEIRRVIYQWVGVGTGGTAYAYNKFGHLSALTNGVNLQILLQDNSGFSSTFRQLSDFTFSGSFIDSVVDDGTNTMVTLRLESVVGQGLVLNSKFGETSTITISDDLSALPEFRVLVQGNEELLDDID